jgi:hypothetical protein
MALLRLAGMSSRYDLAGANVSTVAPTAAVQDEYSSHVFLDDEASYPMIRTYRESDGSYR